MGFWPDFGSYLLFDMGSQRNLNGDGGETAVAVNNDRETPFPMIHIACDGEPMSSSLVKNMKNGLVPLKDFICHANNIINAADLQSRYAGGGGGTGLRDEVVHESVSSLLHN